MINNNSSRYDIMINNDNEQLNLDFILPKINEKLIHGTIWNDSDTPERVNDAIILVFLPGPTYYDKDPNDIKCIDYIIPDSNGEFVAGPFKLNTSVIFKVFNTNLNKINSLYDLPEEFRYINGEYYSQSNSDDDNTESDKGV